MDAAPSHCPTGYCPILGTHQPLRTRPCQSDLPQPGRHAATPHTVSVSCLAPRPGAAGLGTVTSPGSMNDGDRATWATDGGETETEAFRSYAQPVKHAARHVGTPCDSVICGTHTPRGLSTTRYRPTWFSELWDTSSGDHAPALCSPHRASRPNSQSSKTA